MVGLAVDYVVHLAEAYHTSPSSDRLGRIHYMLKTMGVSVLSGACTTLGSSVFMLFAQITFFTQFGMFIFGTIFFSILYAMVFFTAALSLIGPQGNFGSLESIYRPACKLFYTKEKGGFRCEICSRIEPVRQQNGGGTVNQNDYKGEIDISNKTERVTVHQGHDEHLPDIRACTSKYETEEISILS